MEKYQVEKINCTILKVKASTRDNVRTTNERIQLFDAHTFLCFDIIFHSFPFARSQNDCTLSFFVRVRFIVYYVLRLLPLLLLLLFRILRTFIFFRPLVRLACVYVFLDYSFSLFERFLYTIHFVSNLYITIFFFCSLVRSMKHAVAIAVLRRFFWSKADNVHVRARVHYFRSEIVCAHRD